MDISHAPIAADRSSRHGPDPSDPSDPAGPLAVARAIVLVQGAVLVALTIEAAVFAAAFGPGAGAGVVVTALAAVLTLVTAVGLGRGARLAERWTVIAESAVLATGVLDLALALILTGSPVGPVVILTRFVAPLVVIALVRRTVRRVAPAVASAQSTGTTR